MSTPLKKSVEIMAGGTGDCWTGHTAQSWADELTHYSGDCATQVSNMLDAVYSLMQLVPQKVTPQQASMQQASMIAKMMIM
jgi:hypothetical protein